MVIQCSEVVGHSPIQNESVRCWMIVRVYAMVLQCNELLGHGPSCSEWVSEFMVMVKCWVIVPQCRASHNGAG